MGSNGQDWVSQVRGSDDGDDDESSGSLFQDNFRQLVNEEDVESLNVQTIQKQIDKIDDADLLEEAVEIDTRKGSTEAYEDRLEELGEADKDTDEATDESEVSAGAPVDDPEDSDAEDDEGDEDESDESDSGSAWVDDVAGDDEAQDDDTTDEDDDDGAEDDEGDAEEPEDESDADTVPEEDDGVDDEGEGDEDDEDDEKSLQDIGAEVQAAAEPSDDGESTDSEIPDVNVKSIAPSVVSSDEAAQRDRARTMLVWGPEGTGKSHIAHSAPKPVCYIDTEGKADELAEKFGDVYYWQPETYDEASTALDEALEVLAAFREKGVTGTIVVDSMGVMWEWAQVHHMKITRPSAESLDDVQFTSAFSGDGGGDWQKIKGYHNTEFRDVILESPYNVVFTAGSKEKYDFDGDTMDSRWEPEGEKRNKYAVKEVVRLRTDDQGRTVADLHKAARTRYSFAGLLWPEFDSVYDAIDEIATAEQAPEPVDTSQWEFDVYEGQPIEADSEGGSDD